MFSLEKVVQNFIDKNRGNTKNEMQHFAEQKTITCAIRKAAMCLIEGDKRHPHQYRIPGESLAEAEQRLQQNRNKIKKCKSFDELHEIVRALTADIWGIGDLTVYDVSTRIGAYLGIEPTKIYLHCGTREGARALGFKGKEQTMDIAQFPKVFSKLKPHEIEDCLCIYKDDLKNSKHGNGGECGAKKRRKKGFC